jgi:hypothetical protein
VSDAATIARRDAEIADLRRACVQMRAELAAVPRWAPVTERLPEIGEWVLTQSPNGGFLVARILRRDEQETWSVDADHGAVAIATPDAWLPLPAPWVQP